MFIKIPQISMGKLEHAFRIQDSTTHVVDVSVLLVEKTPLAPNFIAQLQ